MTTAFDIIVIGGGAAGLFCAGVAGQRGARVTVLDHAKKPAEKVRISGGGRCNFTNLRTAPDRFLSANPHFAKSALARYTPRHFLDLMAAHGLTWHEKTLGQLFCDQKSGAIIQMLLDEVAQGQGEVSLDTGIERVERGPDGFTVRTSRGALTAKSVVIATGGLSIPKMGATSFAYETARQFGHDIVSPTPALVPFTFSGDVKDRFAALAGVACPAVVEAGAGRFQEAVLFTHRGLSGPAILQASSYWQEGERVRVDLTPGIGGGDALRRHKAAAPKWSLGRALGEALPSRLVEALPTLVAEMAVTDRLADLSHRALDSVVERLSRWEVLPSGTEGWRTAEVTKGGIATSGLSSKTMESAHCQGLYFIGEAVDVTGWLGGYNFQWAWATGHAAGTAAAAQVQSR